jgi:carboxylesterase
MSDQAELGVKPGDVLLEGGRTGFLVIHGLGGTPAEVRLVAQGLARDGHTVLCPLLAGHGGSDLLLSTTRWQDWYASVEHALDILKARCDTVIVSGQSAGAMLALHLAANRPDDIDGMTLYSPTFWPNGWAIPWHLHLFKLITQRWCANLFQFRERAPYGIKDERIRTFVLDSLQKDGRGLDDIHGRRGGTIYEFMQLARIAKRKLPEITVPALVMHSREDDQAHISNATTLVARLGGAVEFYALDDSYHLITLDRQRMFVIEKSLDYGRRTIAAAEKKREAAAAARRPVLREVSGDRGPTAG